MLANIYEDDVEDAGDALAPLVPTSRDNHPPTHTSVLSKYTFAAYRQDGRCMSRTGKYTGETTTILRHSSSHEAEQGHKVRENEGVQAHDFLKMPQGYGTFKSSTGYSFSGDWANGVPCGSGVEVLDEIPTATDPMRGGEIVGVWGAGGQLESAESMRTLKQRFLDGNADQADAMASAGYGCNHTFFFGGVPLAATASQMHTGLADDLP